MRVLFDSGSQKSYISPEAAKLLELKADGEYAMNIKVFGGTNSSKRLSHVKLCFQAENDLKIYVSAFINDICKPLTGQFLSHSVEQSRHLQGLKLADSNYDESLTVDILIGSDFYWSFFTNHIVRGPPNTPVALKCNLGGYVISGPINTPEEVSTNFVSSTHALKIQSEFIDPQVAFKTDLNTLWESESFSYEEKFDLNEFKNNLEFSDNRYQVRLPFNENVTNL